ncbi:MAG: helicase RepA family protein [Chlorobium sp.]|nr:helicase RepA family protein [Chlorobium sp.]
MKSAAKGFKVWPARNAYDFCDEVLIQGDVILDSDHGAVLWEGGIMQLTGKGKVGKTTLLFNILYGVVLGRDVLGFRISKPKKVLYMNGENSPGTLQSLFKHFRKYFCIDEEEENKVRDNFIFHSAGLRLQKASVLEEIRGNLAEIRPQILILDPLKNFYSGDENSSESMGEFMRVVRELMQEFNLTVIIIHHTGKKQNQDAINSGRGSSLLADDAEVTAAFRKNASQKGRFELEVIPRNCEEFTFHLMREPERYWQFSLTDKPEVKPDHILIGILDSLPSQFKTGAFEDAAGKRSIKRSTCFDKIKILENMGIIKRIGHGLYEKVSPVVQTTIGAGLLDYQNQAENESPVVQNSPDCTTQTAEPVDDGEPF